MQAESLINYRVITKCGRNFCWSAHDMESLFRDLHERNYMAVFVQEMSEYEAEIAAKEAQEELVYEINRAIEEDVRKSA